MARRARSARRHETPRAPGVPRGGGSRLLAARRAASAAAVGSAARRPDGAAERAQYSPDEYVQLVATRVHVSRQQRSAFWQSVGRVLVDRSSSAILTVGVQVNGKSVGALPLATIKTARRAAVTRDVKENEPLTSPLRLQQSDQVSLQASLVEATEDTETKW